MKIPVIKKLIEKYTLEELNHAEEEILNEKLPTIELGGDDMGENLTHAIAAAWIKRQMEDNGIPLPKALRMYSQRVRKSIS